MFPETYFVKMYLFAIESKQQVGYVEAARSCARSLKTEYGFWLLARKAKAENSSYRKGPRAISKDRSGLLDTKGNCSTLRQMRPDR
jgi:hypothetical protein